MIRGLLARLRGLSRRFRAPGDRAPLTRDDVVWAYRLFLDREPESEQAILDKLRAWGSTAELRRDFLVSPEFRERNASSAGYLTAPTVLIAELAIGMRLFVDLADTAIGLNVARGLYEPSETAFVARSVRKGQSVLDVGANIGYFTVLMASLVGPKGHVTAYEPLDDNAVLLERSIAENNLENSVSLRRIALGASSASAELVYLPLEIGALNSGGAYIAAPGVVPPPHHRTQSVPVEPLDKQDFPRPVSFIKIDVEGSEPFVFRGARELLASDRPVVLSEINPVQLKAVAGCSPEEFIAEMLALNYRCSILEDGKPTTEVGNVAGDRVRSVVFRPVSG